MTLQEKKGAMFQMMENWEQSGKTQIDFCEENKISVLKFRYWLKKYREKDIDFGFVQLNPVTEQELRIRYPNGVEILIPNQTPVCVIRSLVGN